MSWWHIVWEISGRLATRIIEYTSGIDRAWIVDGEQLIQQMTVSKAANRNVTKAVKICQEPDLQEQRRRGQWCRKNWCIAATSNAIVSLREWCFGLRRALFWRVPDSITASLANTEGGDQCLKISSNTQRAHPRCYADGSNFDATMDPGSMFSLLQSIHRDMDQQA
jgi:hypothetical protein